MSNPGGIRKVWAKFSLSTAVEQTKMTPEFLKAIEHYDKYKMLIDELVDKLESSIQQNPLFLEEGIEYPTGEHPLEKLSASLSIFQTYLSSDRVPVMIQISEAAKKMAAIQRNAQTCGRRAIRHIRRFNSIEYKELIEERNKLDKARECMDQLKHEVKQAKTTEQIEKKATLYEQAVNDFDLQAEKVIALLDQLPIIKQNHQNDLIEYFDVLSKFNEEILKHMDLQ